MDFLENDVLSIQDAINILKVEYLGDSENMELAKQMAVAALNRVMPKKPTHEASLYRCHTCPNCKNVVDEYTEFRGRPANVLVNNCKFCGQALDWEG